MSNYAAYVLWWVPGWGQVLTTTALVTSVLAVGTGSLGVTFSFLQGTTGFTGVGLDGRKLTPAEATRRQNDALHKGYVSVVGMFTGYMNLGIAGDINDKINGNQTPNLGVGNPVKIEGRGSTGRTEANNLNEQMAMHEVKSNPLNNSKNIGLVRDLR